MLSYASLSLGIILAQTSWQINKLWLAFLILIISILCYYYRSKNIFYYLRALLFLLCAYSYADYRIQSRLHKLINYPINHLLITGYFTTPIIKNNQQQLITSEFKIIKGPYSGSKILLFYLAKNNFSPQYIYQLEVNLQPLKSAKNFSAFDYPQYLIAQNIIAKGYLQNIIRQQKLSYTPQALINLMRSNTINYLNKTLIKQDYSGVAIALVTGYSGFISPKEWKIFKNSGIVHIISISGLPIIFLSLICSPLVNIGYYYFPSYKIPKQVFISLTAIIMSLVYALLTGFAIPNQRAFYLVAISAFLNIQRQYLPILYKLTLILAIILIIDPFACISQGFWLTFILVANIFIVNTLFFYEKSPIKQWIRLQITLTLVSLPICLYFFKTFPFISMLSNLWAIPTLGNVMTPLILILTILHCSNMLNYSVYILKYIMYPLEYLAQIPIYWQSGPNLITLIFSYLGLIILIIPLPIKGKQFLAISLYAIFLASINKKRIDYGMAQYIIFAHPTLGIVLTKTQCHTFLTVLSTESSLLQQQLEYTLLPYLLDQHINKIDNVFSNLNAKNIFSDFLNQNKIQLTTSFHHQANIMHYDGITIKHFAHSTQLALQIEDAYQHITYIGNGYYPFHEYKWTNIIVTGLSNDSHWLLETQMNNLLINYPFSQKNQVAQIIDNLNLKAKNIYDLSNTGSIILQNNLVKNEP